MWVQIPPPSISAGKIKYEFLCPYIDLENQAPYASTQDSASLPIFSGDTFQPQSMGSPGFRYRSLPYPPPPRPLSLASHLICKEVLSTHFQDPSLCSSLRPIQAFLFFLISQDFRNFWGWGRDGVSRGRLVKATRPMSAHILMVPCLPPKSFWVLDCIPYLSCMCSHVH